MIKDEGMPSMIGYQEVEEIRNAFHEDAQELFARSLKGGIFGVYAKEGYPFYFVSKQLLQEYKCNIESFIQRYSAGYLSTIYEEERDAFKHDLCKAMEQHQIFDRICKSGDTDMRYMRDIAKLVTLDDGTDIILVLRCNVSEVFEEQLKLKYDADLYVQKNKMLEEITVKIPCAVCMLDIDQHFTLRFANAEFYHLLKYDEKQLREEKANYIDQLIHKHDLAWLTDKINQAMEKQEKEIQLENRIVCRDGTVIWLLVKGYFTYHLDSNEMICSFMDITKRKKIEEDVKISEERFRIALAITDSTIFEYDINTKVMIHGDRSAVAYGIQHITENVPESLLAAGIVHPDSTEAFLTMYRRIREGAKNASCLVLTKLVENGSFVWRKIIMTNVFDDDGRPVQAVGVLEDVDEQVRREKKLLYETERDALTSVYNRRFMVKKIKEDLMNDTANSAVKAILIIDIDDFKIVNDTKGHFFGDFVLTESANRISKACQEDIYVGRIGGDEFLVYFKNAKSNEEVETYGNQLIQSFHEVFKNHDNEIEVTCCIGFAIYPEDGSIFEELYKNADEALYKAKESGKDKMVRFV